jgi:hypothetical protein
MRLNGSAEMGTQIVGSPTDHLKWASINRFSKKRREAIIPIFSSRFLLPRTKTSRFLLPTSPVSLLGHSASRAGRHLHFLPFASRQVSFSSLPDRNPIPFSFLQSVGKYCPQAASFLRFYTMVKLFLFTTKALFVYTNPALD